MISFHPFIPRLLSTMSKRVSAAGMRRSTFFEKISIQPCWADQNGHGMTAAVKVYT